MQAHLALRNVEALHEPQRLPPSPAPIPNLHGLDEILSEREEEIARLAVVGMSNKEIGQRLGISHWTVATHLRRTFLKLEITRRIELCAIIAAQEQARRLVTRSSSLDQEGRSAPAL